MAPINVPPELLRQIFAYLPFSDILNVSRVSRQWHAWSEEQLYKDPSLTANLVPFLRTLLTPGREVLATHVRTFTTESHSVAEVFPDGSDLALFTAAAARFGLHQPLRTINDHVLLLLHLFPRLNALNVRLSDQRDAFDAFLEAEREPADLPLALRTVRRVSCTGFYHPNSVTGKMLLAIFRLPCIRTIVVHMRDEIAVPFATAHHGTSTATRLRIPHYQISIQALGDILRIPHALTHLSITGPLSSYPIHLAALEAALEPVRMTLQSLRLKFRLNFDYVGNVSSDPAPSPLLFLRTWPVLRSLSCTPMVLLGFTMDRAMHNLYDILPPSIRNFGCNGDRCWPAHYVAQQLIMLLERKEQVVPELECLSICLRSGMMEFGGLRLIAACEGAGVRLGSDLELTSWGM